MPAGTGQARGRVGVSPSVPAPDFRAGAVAAAAPMCDDSYMAWTVLVVDDHPAFRASARRLLELDGFRVVGEAGDAGRRSADPNAPACRCAARHRAPDGRLRGGRAARRRDRRRPHLEPGHADVGRRVRESGALGFISKEDLSGEALLALLEAA